MDTLEFLRAHPLLEGVPAETLAALAAKTEEMHYGPGELILRAGEPGVIFGIIREGRAEAVKGYGTGQRKRLGIVEEGECFGEISLMTGESTSADVIALTNVEALLLPEEMFSRTVATNRKSVQYLSRLIARRLRAHAPEPVEPKAARPTYALGATAPMRVLVVNCGSSSLKYNYFDTSSEEPLARGLVERIGTPEARHVYNGPQGQCEEKLPNADHGRAFDAAAAMLVDPKRGVLQSLKDLTVIGHRVVHGGGKLDAPTVVTASTKETIRTMASLAPLHNPVNLLGIELCEKLVPGIPQVAVFDTAFHQKMPPAAYLYAIPYQLAEKEGLRRYGFHGTSHEFVSRCAARHLRRRFSELKLISCHLGNGVSMAAIEHGRSIDTSMGLTPLEGLVMGTRSGDVDPGLLLYLMREHQLNAQQLDDLLNKESGLKGLSGLSQDMRELETAADSGNRNALIAIQCFCYRAKKYLGAYLAALGGADALIFTGGIGQGSPGTRARICQGLSQMGILLDEEANRNARVGAGQVAEISDPESGVRVLVIGTDEERMIAQQAVQAVRHAGVTMVLQQKTDRPIPIGVSAHHVHLTPDHVAALFGTGHQLTRFADLSQPGQYACNEQVALVGPKARIEHIRVLGPVRKESQVEISRTEEFKLGIDAPIRASGDLAGSPGLRLEGSAGSVQLDHGVINALRHIHMSPEDALTFALRDKDVVRVRIAGPRSLIFGDVLVRVHPEFRLEMHIDTDEANAAEISPGAVCYLDSIQERARV
ncbi:MAG: acetate/propionate family kinase [Planctomycetota bacterium]|nr:acetate/propionate family kinase [Planctomycetota bacterium]